MILNIWLTSSVDRLDKAGIDTARLDILVLLEDTLGKDRSWLLAHPELPLDEPTMQKLNTLVKRRATHEPLAYIRGRSEFYDRDFMVTHDTLQPRAETETMIDLLKKLYPKKAVIADVGTGSGCIAIISKLEFPEAEVHATEISTAALKVAQQNAQKLKADITFYKGNLFEPLVKNKVQPTVIMANLPYVPDNYEINQAATHEPKIALFSGHDGLNHYRELFAQISANTKIATKLQFILTESLPAQHLALSKLAKKHGYKLHIIHDFIQVFECS